MPPASTRRAPRRCESSRVYDWLGEMTGTDMTILLVEENPAHAILVADWVVRMYKGLVGGPEVTSP